MGPISIGVEVPRNTDGDTPSKYESPQTGRNCSFKTVYEHESYLDWVTMRKFRRILAQFRVSAHSLKIERGRYSGIAQTNRICKICQSSIEDKYRFVFICDILKTCE